MILLKKDDRKKIHPYAMGEAVSTWLVIWVYRNRSECFQVAISNGTLPEKQREGKERRKGRVMKRERRGEGNTR